MPSLINALRSFLTGLTFPQEYLCLAKEELEGEISVFVVDKKEETDVTNQHLFLGYKPLIIALIADLQDQNPIADEIITLELRSKQKGKLAILKIKKELQVKSGKNLVLFYTGAYGEHSFINRPHQLVNKWIKKIKKRKQGNVGLDGNLYDQVRIAYAIPRTISIVSVYKDNLLNLFPTDLHGLIGNDFYIDSLRKDGKANRQVEDVRKIVLSEVDVTAFRVAYALGKNHMRDFNSIENFSLHSKRSKHFDFPLSQYVIRYRELALIESRDIGIHRLHLFKVVSDERMVYENQNTLAHIHSYYAQWRKNNKLKTNYFLR